MTFFLCLSCSFFSEKNHLPVSLFSLFISIYFLLTRFFYFSFWYILLRYSFLSFCLSPSLHSASVSVFFAVAVTTRGPIDAWARSILLFRRHRPIFRFTCLNLHFHIRNKLVNDSSFVVVQFILLSLDLNRSYFIFFFAEICFLLYLLLL